MHKFCLWDYHLCNFEFQKCKMNGRKLVLECQIFSILSYCRLFFAQNYLKEQHEFAAIYNSNFGAPTYILIKLNFDRSVAPLRWKFTTIQFVWTHWSELLVNCRYICVFGNYIVVNSHWSSDEILVHPTYPNETSIHSNKNDKINTMTSHLYSVVVCFIIITNTILSHSHYFSNERFSLSI